MKSCYLMISLPIVISGAQLYKCANQPCPFTAVNSALFKDHITSCIFTPENKTVKCYHCDKRVKTIPHLLEHIKTHGHQKQFCSLCNFRTWTNSEVTRHMKVYTCDMFSFFTNVYLKLFT
jgi:hypothetical protein